MKVKLLWRIMLTPAALIVLPFYVFSNAWLGLLEWCIDLIKFWNGYYDDEEKLK